MRAIIYTRFSPRRNADESESCEIQEAYCEELAHKKGYQVAAAYSDKAVSGTDEDRPGMWDAINDLKKGDVLLVYKLDRLARNVYLMELLRRAVDAVGAKIEAVSGDIDGDGPEQVMIRQILSVIAEYERKIIAIRTKYAMLQHQKNGKRMGRYPPYGYQINPFDNTLIVPVKSEMEIVEYIHAREAAGDTAYRIAQLLNRDHLDMARGKKWHVKSVDKILKRGF